MPGVPKTPAPPAGRAVPGIGNAWMGAPFTIQRALAINAIRTIRLRRPRLMGSSP